MTGFFTLNHQNFTYESIKSGDFTSKELDEYSLNTLSFCQAWLKGETSFIIQTSGSTGKPKPITLTREQMKASAQMTGKALQLDAGDSSFTCLNTAYIAGIMMLVRGFELGLQMTIVTPSSNPLQHWDSPPTFDFTALVPLQVEAILEQENGEQWLNTMKAMIVGGAPVNYALEQQIKTLDAPVYATYGMTETVTHIALRRINGVNSDGYYHTLPQVEIRQDARQCLEIKSPTTLNEWITTNDLVTITGDNQFKWLGRIDRVINSGGVKIQAEKVEKVLEKTLHQHQFSCRFFVASIPDERLGEKVIGVLEGNSLDETLKINLFETMKAQLSAYEVPKQLYVVPQFAETPTAKIDRLRTLEYLQSDLG